MKNLAIAILVFLFPLTAAAQLVPVPGNPTLEPYNDVNVTTCHECIDVGCNYEMSATSQTDDGEEWEDDVSGALDAYEQIDSCVHAGWEGYESCLDVSAYYCYCGAQTSSQCINNGPAGPCAAEIHQAFINGATFPTFLAEMQFMSQAFTASWSSAGDAIGAMICISQMCGYDCLVQE